MPTSTRAVTAAPGAATSSRVMALVSTIMPPAAVPSTRGGSLRTIHAASGAASTPPIINPATTV